jgi:uncharacterized protein GlcG (DUF336 family)
MTMRCAPTVLFLAALAAAPAAAQAPAAPPAYGPPITLAQARTVAEAAEAEAARHGWPVAIAVVDAGGHLVLLHRLDGTQFGSVEVARQKAWSAAAYRRPTKAFEDALAASPTGARILRVEGAVPIEGGVPLVAGDRIVGAIGVSGVTAQQDGQIAAAGAAALGKAAPR